MHNVIYFDNNSTTKPDDRVVESMMPYFTERYGNASSSSHIFGWEAEAAVEKARGQVAGLIGAEPAEIVFTSCATESINTAIKGIYHAYRSKGNHIITVATEHKAVLDTCHYLEKNEGAEITLLNVDGEGLIDLDELRNSIRPSTILICIMAANNETGVIQPLESISEIAKRNELLFFSDGTQYAGKMQCNVKEMGISAMSLSAHKFHGPKGVGVLYVSRKDPRVNILPLFHGGGQEKGRRAGTHNVPLIVGMGKAAEIAQNEMWENNSHLSKLRAHFEHHLLDMEGVRINGGTKDRLYNTSNIRFPDTYKGIPDLMKRFAFSSGSACVSGTGEPSHVLRAMGMKDDEIRMSYRFSFSKFNSLKDIEAILAAVFNS